MDLFLFFNNYFVTLPRPIRRWNIFAEYTGKKVTHKKLIFAVTDIEQWATFQPIFYDFQQKQYTANYNVMHLTKRDEEQNQKIFRKEI